MDSSNIYSNILNVPRFYVIIVLSLICDIIIMHQSAQEAVNGVHCMTLNIFNKNENTFLGENSTVLCNNYPKIYKIYPSGAIILSNVLKSIMLLYMWTLRYASIIKKISIKKLMSSGMN